MAKKSTTQNVTADKKINDLVAKKMQLAAKIRDLRAEAGKINLELAKKGVDAAVIASW